MPTAGGVDAADSRHRERYTAAVAPRLNFFHFQLDSGFFEAYFRAGDRESDHSGAPFKSAGPAKSPPVGGREPALESVALIAGAGHALGLAQ